MSHVVLCFVSRYIIACCELADSFSGFGSCALSLDSAKYVYLSRCEDN